MFTPLWVCASLQSQVQHQNHAACGYFQLRRCHLRCLAPLCPWAHALSKPLLGPCSHRAHVCLSSNGEKASNGGKSDFLGGENQILYLVRQTERLEGRQEKHSSPRAGWPATLKGRGTRTCPMDSQQPRGL